MGIAQSLQKAITTHPRFTKVQYGADSPITVLHFELDDHQHKLWRNNFYHNFPEVKHWEENQPDAAERKIKQKYPYLMLVKERDIRIVRDGFCGQKCILIIKFNKLWETTLQKEITQRKSIQRYFSQEQIWLMTLHIVQTLLPIHEKSAISILGNLHPDNILINVDGELMLISDVSVPGEKDHFTIFKKHGAEKSYISPELVGFVSKKSYKEYPNYPACVDPQKVEAYALGMILMQLCCLQADLGAMYDNEPSVNYINPQVSRQASSRHNYSNMINQELYSKLMHFIETRYSRMLSMVVKCLTEDKPEDRLSVKQLWSVLLVSKQGCIEGMDEQWYLEALETIVEHNDGEDERKSEYVEDPEYKSAARYEGIKGHCRVGSMEWESMEMAANTTDSHIREWERSLEKQHVEIEVKKVPKIVFTYL